MICPIKSYIPLTFLFLGCVQLLPFLNFSLLLAFKSYDSRTTDGKEATTRRQAGRVHLHLCLYFLNSVLRSFNLSKCMVTVLIAIQNLRSRTLLFCLKQKLQGVHLLLIVNVKESCGTGQLWIILWWTWTTRTTVQDHFIIEYLILARLSVTI